MMLSGCSDVGMTMMMTMRMMMMMMMMMMLVRTNNIAPKRLPTTRVFTHIAEESVQEAIDRTISTNSITTSVVIRIAVVANISTFIMNTYLCITAFMASSPSSSSRVAYRSCGHCHSSYHHYHHLPGCLRKLQP